MDIEDVHCGFKWKQKKSKDTITKKGKEITWKKQ